MPSVVGDICYCLFCSNTSRKPAIIDGLILCISASTHAGAGLLGEMPGKNRSRNRLGRGSVRNNMSNGSWAFLIAKLLKRCVFLRETPTLVVK